MHQVKHTSRIPGVDCQTMLSYYTMCSWVLLLVGPAPFLAAGFMTSAGGC